MPPPTVSDTARVPSHAVDVGIVFALSVEADAFGRLVEDRREVRGAQFAFSTGVAVGRRIAWCISGVGRVAAATAARQLIDGHRPRLIVSAGFAGGLDPDLRRGIAVRPEVAVMVHAARRITLAAAPRPHSKPLAIVTVDAVAATVERKQSLAARSGGQLVDMETFAVAEVAAEAGLPCAAVRVISDDAHETLPGEVASLSAPQSPLRRLGAVVGAVGRRPTAAVDLWRLWERSVVDSRTLADAVADAIRAWPGSELST
jgi:adenosylhomocysteine nucleosidase